MVMTAALFFLLMTVNKEAKLSLSYHSSLMNIVAWVFEHNWYSLMRAFVNHFADKGVVTQGFVIGTTLAFQFIARHVLLPIITAVVIEGYKRYRAFNEYIFNEQAIQHLIAAWATFDSIGEGLMDAKDYLHFIPKLKAPFNMDMHHMFRRLGIGLDDWEDTISSKIILRIDSENQFTTKQFFLYFKLYNVPVYLVNGKVKVHFKDVACHLAKMAIENKYNLKGSIHLSSKRIETILKDMWNTSYPSKIL